MGSDEEKEGLPAFQRSREINEIFAGVQTLLPNMEFSDVDEDDEDENDMPEEIVIRKYKPTVTQVSNHIAADDEVLEENSIPAVPELSGQKAEKEMTELSVHSFIDSLVSQISEAPSSHKASEYQLETTTSDLDLDMLLGMLQTTPDLQLDCLSDHESDLESDASSSSTVVMDELERLAETYDAMSEATTPRSVTPLLRSATPRDTSSPCSLENIMMGFQGGEVESVEPKTVTLDLRPKSPENQKTRPTSGRNMAHHLTKKMIRPPSSDSDDEAEAQNWSNMRKQVKSTSFFTNRDTSGSPDPRVDPRADPRVDPRRDSRREDTNTRNSGTATDIIMPPVDNVKSTGMSTQRTIIIEDQDKENQSMFNRSSTEIQQSLNRSSTELQQNLNRSSTELQHDSKSQSKRVTFSDGIEQSLQGGVNLSNDNLILKESENDRSKAGLEETMIDNEKLLAENMLKQKQEEEERLAKKKKREEKEKEAKLLKQKRIEQMKVREKRNDFRKRLEEKKEDPSTQLVFDVDESFTQPLTDVPAQSADNDQFLVLQLMIDNQGELCSMPPEYYAYCYEDVPTVSCYGTEGVLTWLIASTVTPFNLVSARLTFLNNCLTYVFLIEPRGEDDVSRGFYKTVTHYLNKNSIAQSDPQLFSSTLLNPRDYPFCEPLGKLFLLSRYIPEEGLFTSQPACYTFNLTLDKVNEQPRTRQRATSVTELHHNVAPPSPTEFCVTTLTGNLLKSMAGLFHVLSSIRDTQLEISALRLVQPVTISEERKLCVAVSGFSAISKWADKLGPLDAELALRTDPNSVRAVLNKLQLDQVNLTNTRTTDKTRQEMTRYFGYRFSPDSQLTSTSCDVTSPMVFERSHDYSFLLVSPLISPSLLGDILMVLQDNGVSLLGIRRCRLNYRKCVGIGLSESQTKVFSKFNGTPLTSPSLSSSNGSTPGEYGDRPVFPQNFSTDACPSQPTLASTILFLSKRNGMYHSRFLVKELKSRVVDKNLAHTLQDNTASVCNGSEFLSDPYLYFDMIPYSENNLWNVGGQFGLMPERKTFDFFMAHKQDKISEKSDLEQIVFIALTGKGITCHAGGEIRNIVNYSETLGLPVSETDTGHLELLGVKLISKLNSFQSRELTQYEVGDSNWKKDIQYLQTVPVLALLVRAVNAYQIVRQLLVTRSTKGKDFTHMMSGSPEHAYKLASLLFFEKELYSDEIMRPKQLHLPPPRTHVNSIISKEGRHNLSELPERLVYQSEGILKSMLSPPRLLAALLVTSQIQHFGKIVKRLEQEEFTIVGLYLTGDDRAVVCVQAENSVYKLRELVGPADLRHAKISHQFSLRASFASETSDFYAPSTYENSVQSIKEYFPLGLCCSNTLDMQAEGIPHSRIDDVVGHAEKRQYVYHPCHLKPLLQTVCVVFPPDLLRPAKHTRLSPASQLITLIQSCQFEIMNMRLMTLPQNCLPKFRSLFKIHYEMCQTFAGRPCLAMILQRENAASCFLQILEGYSNNNSKKLLDTYSHMMLYSSNRQKCEDQSRFFFEFLSRRCKDEILVL